MPADLPCAASTLVASVLAADGPLREAARTSVSIHLETGDPDVPVLCVGTPAAVRLPYAVVVAALPEPSDPLPHLRPTRWWTPRRPRGLRRPHPARLAPWLRGEPGVLDPHALLGRGAGLTPDGDDVLAGALVAAAAVGGPALEDWRASTRAALATRGTTAVSVGMLHAALDGWATPELAGAVTALCSDEDPTAAVERLLAVGHTSGRSLLDGVLHALASPAYEGAA